MNRAALHHAMLLHLIPIAPISASASCSSAESTQQWFCLSPLSYLRSTLHSLQRRLTGNMLAAELSVQFLRVPVADGTEAL